MLGAVPPPAARPLERVAGVPRPLCPGCGRRGRGDPQRPHSVRPCGPALLAVGVAEGCPRGGRLPPLCEGRLRSGAVPPPTARLLGRLFGAQHCPSGLHALWGLRAAGVVGGCPRGGGLPPLRGAPGVRRCPSPSRPSCGAGSQGSATRVSRVRSVRAWGPSTGPTACALASRRCSLWGWRKGVSRGGGLPLLRGAPGVRRRPSPGRPSSGAGGQGSVTRVSRVRSVRAWGPSTGPTACALAGRRCLLWGWRKSVPGGGAFHHCEGRLRSGAVPPPTARPFGGLLGSATHVLWAQVCGRGGPTPSPWPACPVGTACRGAGGGPSAGGGWPATVVRGAWCQALSLPRPPVLWSGQPGFRDPCVPGAVAVGVGTQHRPHNVRPCGPALLAVGVAGGRPRGGRRRPL